MKQFKQFTLIGLVISILFSSCTIEKRLYMSGYHLDWKKDNTHLSNEKKLKNIMNQNIQAESENLIEMYSLCNSDREQKIECINETNSNLLIASNDRIVFLPERKNVSLYSKVIQKNGNVKNTEEVFQTKASVKKNYSKKESKKSNDMDEETLIALLLCIFLGALGVHRFYMGYIGMGILYLLTAGLCGIGVLVDIILIATGDLKKRN